MKVFVLKLKFYSPVDVSCLPSEVSSSSVLPKKKRRENEKLKKQRDQKKKE